MILHPLQKIDLFGTPIPSFSFQGEDQARTHIGGIVSFVIQYTVFLFSLLKLSHLALRYNPTVVSFVMEDALTAEDKFALQDQKYDFMIAVGLNGFYSGPKIDPAYIKWFARKFVSINGEITNEIIPMHACTEEDFAKFYPPKPSSKASI